MSLNLLNLDSSEILKFLDWNHITDEISNLTYFDINKNKLKDPPRIFNNKDINIVFEANEYIIANYFELNNLIQESFRYLPNSKEPFLIINRLQKNIIASLLELNFLCNLIESFCLLNKS